MAKINRPTIENPLANMGLDEIVRGITSSTLLETQSKKALGGKDADSAEKPDTKRRKSQKAFEEHLAQYTGISEQGVAIWLPKDVKKELELIRVSASRTIPLRSLAAAIIMTYIDEHRSELDSL